MESDIHAPNDTSALTFGALHPSPDLRDWAVAQEIDSDLSRVIDVTITRDRPDALGNVVNFLGDTFVWQLYDDWSRTSVYAQPLARVASAIHANRDSLSRIPALGHDRAAKHYFRRELDERYLAALLVARRPVPSTISTEPVIQAFTLLRAWALYRSMRIFGEYGYRHEVHLATLCSKLRIATDDDDPYLLSAIGRLFIVRASCQRPDRLERMLVQIARGEHRNATDDSVATFFKSVADCVDAPPKLLEIRSRALPPPEVERAGWSGAVIDISPLVESVSEPDTPEFTSIPGDSSGTAALLTIPTKPSFAFEHLNNRARLVLSAEALHFLPGSWQALPPHEKEKLVRLSARLAGQADAGRRLLGAIIEIALRGARSLRLALEIGFSPRTDGEWWINLDERQLCRRSPRRKNHWKPSEDTRDWVASETPFQKFRLSDASLSTLQELESRFPEAGCLGDFWQRAADESPEQAFHRETSDLCPRVTPGMLANALATEVQRHGRDATLTRLAISHPRSELPGACAYATFSGSQLGEIFKAAFPNWTYESPNLLSDDSAAGSLLAVIEGLLPSRLEQAAQDLERRRARLSSHEGHLDDLIEFHNRFVTYVVTLLLAATGARPVRDPFESPHDFNWTRCWVFIEDKAQDDDSFGRLVPIPPRLIAYLESTYLDHLSQLARVIAPSAPGLSAEIDLLASRNASTRIPFFFGLVAHDSSLRRIAVSEQLMQNTGLFGWPLPWNFFRHRLATRLRHLGVDAEIIDGLLGHAEYGAETYGDDSFRTWQKDIATASPHLVTLFDALAAPMPAGLSPTCSPLRSIDVAETPLTPDPGFGRHGRRERRQAWRVRMKTLARDRLRLVLGDRNVASLSAEQLDEIGITLLFGTDDVAPADDRPADQNYRPSTGRRQTSTPRGWICYLHFLHVLDRYGRLYDKALLPKRLFTRKRVISPFKELSAHASSIRDALRRELKVVLGRRVPASYSLSATYGVLLVALESRACDPAVLLDILEGKNHRLVRIGDTAFLDYAEELNAEDADAAVKRYAISGHAAALLHHVLWRNTAARSVDRTIPGELASFANVLTEGTGIPTDNLAGLVKLLCQVVDQANVVEVPGIVAGLLAGRVESWAPSLRVQADLMTGKARRFPESARTDADAEEAPTLQIAAAHQGDDATLRSDRMLVKRLRNALREYGRGKASQRRDGTNTDVPRDDDAHNRRSLSSRLKQMVDAEAGRISPIVAMLAMWAISHVQRKYKKRYIAISSLLRYMGALANAFVELGTRVDLRVMDADDVTSLFAQILALRSHERPAYRYERLREFSRWCGRHHGAATADWSSLSYEAASYPASFGLIAERQYLQAIEALTTDCSPDALEDLAPALALMMCYRYGLRPNEARGLLRSEVLNLGSRSMVIVQTNRLRRTKTSGGSQRVVPLVFELTEIEKSLWNRWFRHLATSASSGLTEPFFSDSGGRLIDGDQLFPAIAATLKTITGNPVATLYHARHTAATAVGAALTDFLLPACRELPGHSNEGSRRQIQETLLGYPGVSRRCNWAIARYLGHTNVTRSQISYLHFLWDWAAGVALSHLDDLASPVSIDDLSSLPILTPPSVSRTRASPASYSVVEALRYLRLRGEGQSHADTARFLSIDETRATRWAELIHAVDRRLLLQGDPLNPDVGSSARVLTHVTQYGWLRLFRWAADAGPPPSLESALGNVDARQFLAEMIGPSRQIVVWRGEQFAFLRSFCDYWDIQSEQIRLVPTRAAHLDQVFAHMAMTHGFCLTSPTNTNRKRFQIDRVISSRTALDHRAPSDYRCAFVIRESKTGVIRNSFEVMAAALALVTITRQAMPQAITSPDGREDLALTIKMLQERIRRLEERDR